MAISYAAKGLTNTTSGIGHSYAPGTPLDSYTNTRYFCRMDLSGYTGDPATFYPATGTADGSITRTETVAGPPPDLQG